MAEQSSGVGRPRRSSKRILEEAAAELFLEQSYAGTTIDQIASRAGVSRNTFFNYFASKADLLWVDFDEVIGRLADELAAVDRATPAIDGLADAIVRVAASYPESNVPWALTQFELMGTLDELQASGLARFMRQSVVIQGYLAERMAVPSFGLVPQSIAYAVLAAAAAAAGVWAGAGVGRRALADYVSEAIAPVCQGFSAAVDTKR